MILEARYTVGVIENDNPLYDALSKKHGIDIDHLPPTPTFHASVWLAKELDRKTRRRRKLGRLPGTVRVVDEYKDVL